MARRKKKASALSRKQQKAPTPKFSWSFEDTMELIAWLDHTVKHKAINFDDSVVGHLKQARDTDYTIKQVKTKLEALWTKIGRDYYPRQKSWKDVFDHGSKILMLTPEEADSVAQARKRIEEQATTTLLETLSSLAQNDSTTSLRNKMALHLHLSQLEEPSVRLATTKKNCRDPKNKRRHYDLYVVPALSMRNRVLIQR
jgi:hypothetical protein